MSQLLAHLQQTRLLFTLAPESQKTVRSFNNIHCRLPGLLFPLRRGNFGDSATKKAVLPFFNAHAQSCLISTSGLNPVVTMMFFDPDLQPLVVLKLSSELSSK